MLDPADALAIIRGTSSENTVLVGGQAVMLWAAYFGLHPSRASLTADVDYLGKTAEAKRLSAALKLPHRIALPGMDEATPNTAVLTIRLPGYADAVVVDYLSGVAGIKTGAVEKAAVTIVHEGVRVRVMHPIDCLKSKLSNLTLLASKRTPEGIEQAMLATRIAAAFLGMAIDQWHDTRAILRAIESVAVIAQSKAAVHCLKHFGVDCSAALPANKIDSAHLPPRFLELRWPKLRSAVERKLAPARA